MKDAQGFDFTVDWFSYNIPAWEQVIAPLKPTQILEIGCYEGRSTCYLMQRCTQEHGIELHCVDTWDGGEDFKKGAFGGAVMSDAETRFEHNTEVAGERALNPVTLVKHKARSALALNYLIATKGEAFFDLIYIDGSHQAADVLIDCILSFQLLRVGGVLIFDDYLWCMEADGKQDPLGMPKPAIDAFLNIFQRKMKVIPSLPIYQLYAHKTGV